MRLRVHLSTWESFMKYIKGSDADEAYFYRAYQILSEVSVRIEDAESLYINAYLFTVRH